MDDYTYNGTTCVPFLGCAACNVGSDTTCTSCKDGYYLFRGACRLLSNLKVFSGSTVLTANGGLATVG